MKSILKTLLTGLTVAGAVAGVQAAGAPKPVVAHVQKGSFPVMTLTDRQSGGQRAVDLLGTRLPTVAAWFRKSPDEFKAPFGTQFDWDANGQLSPASVRDPETLDERRASVGLPPMAETIAHMRANAATEGDTAPADLAERRAAYDAWARKVGWRA